MSLKSLIEWTHSTINFWWGCTEVSPACAFCYAREWAKFTSNNLFGWVVEWGTGKPRAQRLDAARLEALKLNARAEKSGQRIRVFANSMSDWLDDEVPTEWRAALLRTIRDTPWLDWQLLSKRPQNWADLINDAAVSLIAPACDFEMVNWIDAWSGGTPPANVWIGTTVEDQIRAEERIPALLAIPAKVRFLSCEPLLGFLDLPRAMEKGLFYKPDGSSNAWSEPGRPMINWVIVGGESGPKARPMHYAWARGVRAQCALSGAPFFFKQWGEWLPSNQHPFGKILFPNGLAIHQWGAGAGIRSGDGSVCIRIGKKLAGRQLDGVEHNAFPG